MGAMLIFLFKITVLPPTSKQNIWEIAAILMEILGNYIPQSTCDSLKYCTERRYLRIGRMLQADGARSLSDDIKAIDTARVICSKLGLISRSARQERRPTNDSNRADDSANAGEPAGGRAHPAHDAAITLANIHSVRLSFASPPSIIPTQSWCRAFFGSPTGGLARDCCPHWRAHAACL
jgi:hypothetical protein